MDILNEVERWLTWYAAAHGYMDVLKRLPEMLGSLSPCILESCILEHIICRKDFDHYDLALKIVIGLLPVVQKTIKARVVVRLIESIKALKLFTMLKGGTRKSEMMRKLQEYYPQLDLSSAVYGLSTVPKEKYITKSCEYRNFFHQLLTRQEFCNEYFELNYHTEFGSPSYAARCEELVLRIVKSIQEMMPPSPLDRILELSSSSTLHQTLRSYREPVIEILLDTCASHKELSQAQCLDLLGRLRPKVSHSSHIDLVSSFYHTQENDPEQPVSQTSPGLLTLLEGPSPTAGGLSRGPTPIEHQTSGLHGQALFNTHQSGSSVESGQSKSGTSMVDLGISAQSQIFGEIENEENTDVPRTVSKEEKRGKRRRHSSEPPLESTPLEKRTRRGRNSSQYSNAPSTSEQNSSQSPNKSYPKGQVYRMKRRRTGSVLNTTSTSSELASRVSDQTLISPTPSTGKSETSQDDVGRVKTRRSSRSLSQVSSQKQPTAVSRNSEAECMLSEASGAPGTQLNSTPNQVDQVSSSSSGQSRGIPDGTSQDPVSQYDNLEVSDCSQDSSVIEPIPSSCGFQDVAHMNSAHNVSMESRVTSSEIEESIDKIDPFDAAFADPRDVIKSTLPHIGTHRPSPLIKPCIVKLLRSEKLDSLATQQGGKDVAVTSDKTQRSMKRREVKRKPRKK